MKCVKKGENDAEGVTFDVQFHTRWMGGRSQQAGSHKRSKIIWLSSKNLSLCGTAIVQNVQRRRLSSSRKSRPKQASALVPQGHKTGLLSSALSDTHISIKLIL